MVHLLFFWGVSGIPKAALSNVNESIVSVDGKKAYKNRNISLKVYVGKWKELLEGIN